MGQEVRVITIVTDIAAPPEDVFDLCLDVQEHAKSLGDTGEKIVGGVTTGLMKLGDTLVLQGWHFGCRFKLGVKVTEYDRPRRFVDEMVSGPFKSVWHEHLFEHTTDRHAHEGHVQVRGPPRPARTPRRGPPAGPTHEAASGPEERAPQARRRTSASAIAPIRPASART